MSPYHCYIRSYSLVLMGYLGNLGFYYRKQLKCEQATKSYDYTENSMWYYEKIQAGLLQGLNSYTIALYLRYSDLYIGASNVASTIKKNPQLFSFPISVEAACYDTLRDFKEAQAKGMEEVPISTNIISI